MRIPESCAKCLYDRQRVRCQDEKYLAQVKKLIDERGEDDTSPLLVYRFNSAYVRRFGKTVGYADVKCRYNDLMLKLEDRFRMRIESSQDPVETALALARAMSIMSVVGFFAHGFKMTLNTNIILWCVIYTCLAFLIGFYVCAVKHDIDGKDKKFFRISMILSGIVAVLMVIMLIIIPDYSYTAFSVFCLVYLVYCIVKLFRQRRGMPELNWYLVAIFVLIIGCILQSIKSIHFTILNWEFNYNAVYHFCILLFLLIQFKGIRKHNVS